MTSRRVTRSNTRTDAEAAGAAGRAGLHEVLLPAAQLLREGVLVRGDSGALSALPVGPDGDVRELRHGAPGHSYDTLITSSSVVWPSTAFDSASSRIDLKPPCSAASLMRRESARSPMRSCMAASIMRISKTPVRPR